MTEAEWLTGADPEPMLRFLKGKVSDRKLRLFAVACCRHIGHLIRDERSRAAVEMSEHYADGLVDQEALQAAHAAAAAAEEKAFAAMFFEDGEERDEGPAREAAALVAQQPLLAFRVASEAQAACVWTARRTLEQMQAAKVKEKKFQCELLRDIFGNPFRPVTVDAVWLTSEVRTLARHIYHDRDFRRMPELAEALQAANCNESYILEHCLQEIEHVRGCYVLDLLLDKS